MLSVDKKLWCNCSGKNYLSFPGKLNFGGECNYGLLMCVCTIT